MPTRRKSDNRCPECRLFQPLCICAQIPKLELKTRLVVLMHWREWRLTTNTASLASVEALAARVTDALGAPVGHCGEQIPLGASQEQVLLVLGTPSTVATVSGEAFYYISQRAQRPISFVDTTITDQRVIVVYFDKNRKVQRLAEYGMKDGKVFDFISRTTPTTGAENNIVTYLFRTIKGQGS